VSSSEGEDQKEVMENLTLTSPCTMVSRRTAEKIVAIIIFMTILCWWIE
jgi:hypothetical protein